MKVLEFTDKINRLRELIEIQQTIEAVNARYKFAFPDFAEWEYKVDAIWQHKYIYINIGSGGRYMVEKPTGLIFGIKSYGKVNRRKVFGTLDTITDFNWGGYWAKERKAV